MLWLLLCLATCDSARGTPPNIVWILTDDQDQLLGGSFPTLGEATPMSQTRTLMQEGGVMATNMFIHTPICCPSRSELLTGRYLHNIKMVGTRGTCMHANASYVNENTFARELEAAGYKVGLFGKYINNMPAKAPPGFDAFFANGGGNYIAPEFLSKGVDGIPDGQWAGTKQNYTTAVVGNLSIAWIEKQAAAKQPFFAYIAPKAAHEPFIPAPWHLDFWDPSWPATEPRPAAWNLSAEERQDHHGNIATEPMITEDAAVVITDIFKNRWRTLMSVDDVIASVYATVDQLGLMDNTYFIFSSDHGFQLGEFNILMDKRHVYDTNIRIHLLATGPGITPGSTFDQPATQVDLTPTFLGLCGVPLPERFDGKSMVPLLLSARNEALDAEAAMAASLAQLPHATLAHLEELLGESVTAESLQRYTAAWRDHVFVEYYFIEDNIKCVENCSVPSGDYPNKDAWCGDLDNNAQCWGISPAGCNRGCHKTEDTANNFIALRHMAGSKFGNTLYAEFQTGNLDEAAIEFDAVDFQEYYDVSQDPWQITNAYKTLPADTRHALRELLHTWYGCEGKACP